jgi:predicted DNA-binding transcriptional regulator AlpA
MSSFHNHVGDLAVGSSLEPWLTDVEVAQVTGMSLAWVRRQRLLDDGPPYRRLGGCVRYDPAELRAWLACRPGGGNRSNGGGR